MSIENNPIGRTDMLSWLNTQGDDATNYDDMSDHELRVLYEERRNTSDDYLDDYNQPLKQMGKNWVKDKEKK
jgi:hypothetical protein